MNRFSVLDGWRGMCALLVALFHLSAASHIFYVPLVRQAGMFVDFFFVLSGFVLAHAYSLKIETPDGLGNFLIRRIGRLWPLHVFMLGLFILLECAKWGLMTIAHISAGDAPFTGTTSIPAIFTNIFLIHSLGFHGTETWNGPSWSISTEFWVNVIFGAVILTLGRRIILCSVILISASIGILLLFNQGNLGATSDYGIFRCLYGFFAGVVVYQIHLRFHDIPLRFPHLAELLALAAAIVYASNVYILSTNMLTPIIFGLVILIFARESGVVSKAIKNRAFHYLGLWSYSIYLVHSFVLAVMSGSARALQKMTDLHLLEQTVYLNQKHEMLAFGNEWQMDLLTLAYLATVIGISALTFRYIEEPCRIYFNGIAKRFSAQREARKISEVALS
jgi:peptidoglycan/LPS O-acetylase OafA/YrhL